MPTTLAPAPTPGSGPDAAKLEGSIHQSFPQGGYFEDRPIPLGSFRLPSGAGLSTSAAANPYFVQPDSTNYPMLHAIQWRQDADSTNFASVNFQVPGEYNPAADKLLVLATLRKADADNVDENSDLSFQVDASWYRPGLANPAAAAGAVPTELVTGGGTYRLAAPVTRRFKGIVIPTVMDWFTYQFDLSQGVGRDSTRRVLPHDCLSLSIAPNETLGTTNMTVDMLAFTVRWVRSASLHDRTARFDKNRVRAR